MIIHIEHGNPPNMGGFVCSVPFHTCRAQKHTQCGCVFAFDAVPHMSSTETTQVGCVFAFDAVPYTLSTETHSLWVRFRVRRRSIHVEHRNHPIWVCFRVRHCSMPFRTVRAWKHTLVGCGFVVDAVLHSLNMETTQCG